MQTDRALALRLLATLEDLNEDEAERLWPEEVDGAFVGIRVVRTTTVQDQPK